MNKYHLTVFQKDGQNLLNQTFEASTNEKAKEIGMEILQQGNYHEQTHRCVALDGELILFHR